ncbi:MAG: hypothetical protein V4724_04040 [Pseudomonadota bacterium]
MTTTIPPDAANGQGKNPEQDKQGGGNVALGHPANNVITHDDPAHGETPQSEAADTAGSATHTIHNRGAETKGEAGTKGSGMPVLSGAGQLADDRPGRNDPKGS